MPIPTQKDVHSKKGKPSIYDTYFECAWRHHEEIDGNIVVFMQVGSFYEIYYAAPSHVTDKETGVATDEFYARLRRPVLEACKACDLKHSKKQAVALSGRYEIFMSGFQLLQLEKYLSILVEEHGFSVPVYTQEFDGPNAPRSLKHVYSPGTYIPEERVSLTNHIMCVWVEVTRRLDRVHLGVATIDAGTSKTSCDEFSREYHLQPTTFDDVERSVSIYRPSEVIFVGNLDAKTLETIVHFVGVDSKAVRCVSTLKDDPKFNEHAAKCGKQLYQDGLIRRFFPSIYSDTFFHDFALRPVGTQAFCFLLHFVQVHNERLLRDLVPPNIDALHKSRQVVLANNCLEQLNVVDPRGNLRTNVNADTEATHRRTRNVRSLLGYLDECLTRIGRREFHHVLQHPIADAKQLEESYDLIGHVLSLPHNFLDSLREKMRDLSDCEHFHYKRRTQRVSPFDFYVLYQNLTCCFDLVRTVSSDTVLRAFFEDRLSPIMDPTGHALDECSAQFHAAANFIDAHFHLDALIDERRPTFQRNIFVKGNYLALDEKHETHLYAGVKLDAIRDHLDGLLARTEKGALGRDKDKDKNKTRSFVSKNVHAMTPTDLSVTERRAGNLRREIERVAAANGGSHLVDVPYARYEDALCDTKAQGHGQVASATGTIQFDLAQIDFRPRSTHTTKAAVDQIIVHPTIKDLAASVHSSSDELVRHLHEAFEDATARFYDAFRPTLDMLVAFIRHLDVLQCKAHVARVRHLARPVVVPETDSPDAFVHVDGLRHCLVEANSDNETYVSNDVRLGAGPAAGILLYGTNAVGKTCLIKALGMAVLMAQAGFYVPCDAMRFSPYRHIFTRIVNRDDLFRGLSTFALEMSELRTILQMHDERSLVLGDELCSGTENVSAISIFVAGLEQLHAKRTSFIFATHFHELQHLPEVQALGGLAMKHMKVHYDAETKRLVYDRKLCDGCGDAMYGLEVCRSLFLSNDFLARAHEVRANLSRHSAAEPPVLRQKRTAYSRRKLVGMCERCKARPATETHHLVPQKAAGPDGYVSTDRGTFHKDHPANLKPLCEECHLLEHNDHNQIPTVLR